MRVFLTGVTGFVGSHVAKQLVSQGHEVTGLIRKGSNDRHLRMELQGCRAFTPVRGDIMDANNIRDCMNDEYDVVIHAAGSIREKDYRIMRRTNVDGTENLLKAIVNKAPSLKHFIHLSTVTVTGPVRSQIPLDEDSPCFPETHYEITKYLAEQVVIRYCQEFGIRTTILRPTRVYGPHDSNPEFYKLMKLISMGICPMFGGATLSLDLVYVDNLVKAIIMCTNNRPDNLVLIISDGHTYTQGQFMNTLRNAVGKKAITVRVPFWVVKLYSMKTKSFRYLVNNVRYSSTRAKTELGYFPDYGLYDGLLHTVDWYRRNGSL